MQSQVFPSCIHAVQASSAHQVVGLPLHPWSLGLTTYFALPTATVAHVTRQRLVQGHPRSCHPHQLGILVWTKGSTYIKSHRFEVVGYTAQTHWCDNALTFCLWNSTFPCPRANRSEGICFDSVLPSYSSLENKISILTVSGRALNASLFVFNT